MNETYKSRTRKILGLALVVALAAACVAGQPGRGRASAQGTVRILAHYDLPEGTGITTPTDIRWAGDDAVFVSRSYEGVFEIALEANGKTTKRRQPVPNRDELDKFGDFTRLAVSAHDLVASSFSMYFLWRPIELQKGGTVDFEKRPYGIISDMDAQGDRLALLGTPYDQPEAYLRNPGVLWLGSLSKKLEDFRPLRKDEKATAAGGSLLWSCYTLDMGSVRFLPDGSLVAVPGFESGAYLYSPEGRQLRAWTNQELGIDSGCAGFEDKDHNNHGIRKAWSDRSRIVDDILPLPQGPGLLIRWVGRDGKPRWVLKVLAPHGILTYGVPLTGASPHERLRGDVRQGKIVLLRTLDANSTPVTPGFPGEILIAALPAGSVPGSSRPASQGEK